MDLNVGSLLIFVEVMIEYSFKRCLKNVNVVHMLCFSMCIWTACTRVQLYFFVQSRLHVFEGMWIPLSDSSEILENVQWALRKSARTLRPVARFREISTFSFCFDFNF